MTRLNGQLEAVSVLPDGRPDANATVAGSLSGDRERVISDDGSRIFWTDGTTKDLYVRENDTRPQSPLGPKDECTVPADACTVEVDASQGPGANGGGVYWTASSDGSKVFFTDENQLTDDSTAAAGAPDLYEYDVQDGALADLSVDSHTGEHANVVGVLGASEDGSYVYFAAGGALASGATPQGCPPEEEGKYGERCNVYVIHEGEEPRIVATVGNHDGEGGTGDNAPEWNPPGDWTPGLGARSAQVTPNGQHLVFESIEDLTGFDTKEGREIYIYDFGSGLTCVSCNPSDAPSFIGAYPYYPHGELARSNNSTYVLRDMSADGDQVFFDSKEALVPQDENGLEDVYEWERDGSGSCGREKGCLYLLSGGTSTDVSEFVDASENGDDVFLETRAQLVPQDRGEVFEVYDARVDAPQQPTPPACTGTGCQGVPGAPPIFATPSSVTFNGIGNFPPPPPPTKVTKKTVKCPKSKKLRDGKCVKRKGKRATKKAKKSNRTSNDRRAK